jgi:adenylosuccinate synthase
VFYSKNYAVIGLQWGDEGKGKIVDSISANFGSVARFNGGNNAGHTIILKDKTYKLQILPSGVLRDDVISVIGNGAVIDPWCLLKEIDLLKSQSINIDHEKLLISDRCHIVLPLHKQLDALFEQSQEIGTTGCGIGPCYQDKVARRGMRLCDLKDKGVTQNVLRKLVDYHNATLRGFNKKEVSYSDLAEKVLLISDKVTRYCASTTQIRQILKNKPVLFEGAQGMLLDIDHGTYPFVTSSAASAFQCAIGTGLDMPGRVIGVLKCYSTRVGGGPFPTEQDNKFGKKLQELGKEFGTVSSRIRRCGWFDVPLARYSAMLSGASELALTKIDVLDSFEKVKICNGYNIDGQVVKDFSEPSTLHKAIPKYIELDGWNCSTYGKKNWHELPKNACAFIELIEELVGLPVKLVSTGPERNDMIKR